MRVRTSKSKLGLRFYIIKTYYDTKGIERTITVEKLGSEQEIREKTGRDPMDAQSDYQRFIRQDSNGVYNHDITIHNDKTKKIIAMVPDGGNYKDLPEELQQTRKVHIAWTRLNSKKPSFTIDCGHNHHFHYRYRRRSPFRYP